MGNEVIVVEIERAFAEPGLAEAIKLFIAESKWNADKANHGHIRVRRIHGGFME